MAGRAQLARPPIMCTFEEMVELDMEIVDAKKFEEMFEKANKISYTRGKPDQFQNSIFRCNSGQSEYFAILATGSLLSLA